MFKVGDVVYSKWGGAKMIVVDIPNSFSIICVWEYIKAPDAASSGVYFRAPFLIDSVVSDLSKCEDYKKLPVLAAE